MKEKSGLSLAELIALIVGSSIGPGVYGICSDLANVASPGPALIAWLICGIGIFSLVFSLNNLLEKRSDLSSGIFSYAGEAFGPLGEFLSGWGYWLSAWLGNVAFGTFLMSAVGEFFPIFKGGQNLPSVIVAVILVWLLTLLVNRGFESASFINMIITICKVIPLVVFIIAAVLAFKAHVFTSDFWGNVIRNASATNSGFHASTFQQIFNSIIVMVWVLTGTETASVLSSRARTRHDAQLATILGTVTLLFIYTLVSILPYGLMSRSQIASYSQPVVANLLGSLVGHWGVVLVNIGIIIAVIGCWLSWTMLPAETTRLMSDDGVLPKSWGKVNAKESPTNSLVISAGLQSIFLFTLLFTTYAYHFAYTLAAAAILISYILVGAYQIIYSYQHNETKGILLGALLVVFELIAIISSWQRILALTIAYAFGFIFYVIGRKQHKLKLTNGERLTIAITCLLAVISCVMIFNGILNIN
ncbi:MAG: basic amino acid/polyamine antiporter [Limosilactobacillus sp.]|jgi:arginine:ornithine antiporter/lysine permease|uniref:basic amino acid/polyamine antiporter n=1 Tax=Limosilactobacillus sp. TaxID=2773925 RepID=UPI0025B866A4|nr:basic amino acid/polyamine antiporter [Limosilactobacillus sp.]MCI1974368.1 basic amino acid/polyamine antiporter [Limosilactobacillus sp.]MCI2030555.1 basic amino acid/polyamine antiporter [Limosilactobacillus sp.]